MPLLLPPHRTRRSWLAGAAATLAIALPAGARQSQQNQTAPRTIPGLDNYSLPSSDRLRPAQTQPLPTPTPTQAPVVTIPPVTSVPGAVVQPLPTPSPTPVRRNPTPAPSPSATARPPITATPTPIPLSTPAAAPDAEPGIAPIAPAPVPTSPVRADTVPPTAPAAATSARPSLLWIGFFLLLLLLPAALVALWFWRRAPATARDEPSVTDLVRSDATPAAPPVVPRQPPGTSARAELDIAFRPRRAGTNITSAAVDYELVVANRGTAPAHDLRIGIDLVTAGDHHDTDLARIFAAPVARPVVAPFDLAAGETRTVRALVMLPREAINVVSVKGRPMFVPIVAINARYADRQGDAQATRAHVVGLDRGPGQKMRPIWLGADPRMHTDVAQSAHRLRAGA